MFNRQDLFDRIIHLMIFEVIIRLRLVFTSAISLVVLIVFHSCNNNEPCDDCSEKQLLSPFSLKYLRLAKDPRDGTPIFYEYDTIKDVTTEYRICSFDHLKNLEERKIIKAIGNLFYSCKKRDLLFIAIDDYEVVKYCSPPIKLISGVFELNTQKWYIHSILSQDTVLFVPCESSNLNPFVLFAEGSVQGLACVNSFSCSVTLQGSNQFKLSNCGYSLLMGTKDETFFEVAFEMVMQDNMVLDYSIENSVLIIQNSTNNSSIKLHAR